jgi:hypothetical protein
VNCQERNDLMLLYVADGLDAAERSDLTEHLSTGCLACDAALAEAKATFASVALSLGPVAVPAALKQRLMQRVGASDAMADSLGRIGDQTAAAPADRDTLADTFALRMFRLLVPAAIAASVAVVITHALLISRVRQMQGAQLRADALQMIVDTREREIDQLQQQLGRQKTVLALLQSPTSGVTRLAGKNQPQATAELVWDSVSRQSVLLTSNMSPPPPGRTYELWYITADQQKLAAGTFDVDAAGAATMQSSAPPSTVGKLAAAAVTDEPIGGLSAPTGKVQLVGMLQ